eukprot:GILK01010597.1.p1 GENE.GILK01010597.1~~GILK01010597.1.p1  ORF type:complete len:806 (+),score=193.85 GILK01010597.1:31-2448(+)
MPAWKELRTRLFQEIQEILKSRGIKFFSELGESEKAKLVQEAEQRLVNEPLYRRFMKEMSVTVDKNLIKEVNSAISPEQSSNMAVKAEVLLNKAADAAGRLVRVKKPPRERLLVLLNQVIPPTLRREIWALCLHNATARATYEEQLRTQPERMISSKDSEVTANCEKILNASFPSLLTRSGLLNAMKIILSYHHALTAMEDVSLYYLIAPLLAAYFDDSGAQTVISQLVEQFLAVMALKRPVLVDKPTSDIDKLACRQLVTAFTESVAQKDPEIAIVLRTVLNNSDYSKPTTTASAAAGVGGIQGRDAMLLALLEPLVNRLFSGVVQLDVLMHIWDTLLLGGIDRMLVPCLVGLFISLRSDILRCTSFAELTKAVHQTASQITLTQFINELESHFMGSTRAEMAIVVPSSVALAESVNDLTSSLQLTSRRRTSITVNSSNNAAATAAADNKTAITFKGTDESPNVETGTDSQGKSLKNVVSSVMGKNLAADFRSKFTSPRDKYIEVTVDGQPVEFRLPSIQELDFVSEAAEKLISLAQNRDKLRAFAKPEEEKAITNARKDQARRVVMDELVIKLPHLFDDRYSSVIVTPMPREGETKPQYVFTSLYVNETEGMETSFQKTVTRVTTRDKLNEKLSKELLKVLRREYKNKNGGQLTRREDSIGPPGNSDPSAGTNPSATGGAVETAPTVTAPPPLRIADVFAAAIGEVMFGINLFCGDEATREACADLAEMQEQQALEEETKAREEIFKNRYSTEEMAKFTPAQKKAFQDKIDKKLAVVYANKEKQMWKDIQAQLKANKSNAKKK